MGINIFDIGILLMFIMFIIVGWKNGVIKELFSFLGILLVFIISFSLKGIVGNLLCTIFPFFEFGGYIKGLVSLNILIYHTIAFILLFSLLLCIYRLILKFSEYLQKILNYTIIFIIPSKILGALVSFIEGWMIIFIILIALIIPLRNEKVFTDSVMVNKVLFNTPILSKTTKSFTSSVGEIYDLTSKISMEELDINEANLESINIMLKYKIVDKNTIKELVKLKKLDDIKNIESVLIKY